MRSLVKVAAVSLLVSAALVCVGCPPKDNSTMAKDSVHVPPASAATMSDSLHMPPRAAGESTMMADSLHRPPQPKGTMKAGDSLHRPPAKK